MVSIEKRKEKKRSADVEAVTDKCILKCALGASFEKYFH